MVASFEGKADIVHKLIWAKADTDAQNQVASQWVSKQLRSQILYLCNCTDRKGGQLFIWQLRVAKLKC